MFGICSAALARGAAVCRLTLFGQGRTVNSTADGRSFGVDADAWRDLLGCFGDLPDPRVERTRLHRLDDMIAIAILAVLCGAEGWPKDNQPTLHEDVKLLFDEAIQQQFEHPGYDYCEQVEKGHGRIGTRRVWVTRDVYWLRERSEPEPRRCGALVG